MKKICVLSLDLGTGGVKASLVDSKCNILCNGFASYKTYCPSEIKREQRPEDWWEAVVTAVRQMVSEANSDDVAAIAAVAISGHSMGRVPVTERGELLEEYTPIWSDSRAREESAEFLAKIGHESWYSTTGNGSPPPHYAAFKIMQLKRQQPEI